MSNSKQVVEWRRRMKRKAVAYLGGKCIRCGYDKCIRALSFHHRNPQEKLFGIAEPHTKKWSVIQIELDKCDLLCLNCHAEEEQRIFGAIA
jgi:hypothetical protein